MHHAIYGLHSVLSKCWYIPYRKVESNANREHLIISVRHCILRSHYILMSHAHELLWATETPTIGHRQTDTDRWIDRQTGRQTDR